MTAKHSKPIRHRERSNLASEEQKVGYKSPPKNTQFKKGQSGNPSGRPKGSKSVEDAIFEQLGKEIGIPENGQTVIKQFAEIIAMSMCKEAAKGSYKHARLVMEVQDRVQERLDREEAKQKQEEEFENSYQNRGSLHDIPDELLNYFLLKGQKAEQQAAELRKAVATLPPFDEEELAAYEKYKKQWEEEGPPPEWLNP